MASNVEDFIRETNAKIKKLQEKQASEAKKIVLTGYKLILDESPVNTGLFKHNHIITPNGRTEETKDKRSNINENNNIINNVKFNHNDYITIQNNLKYADALEAGHSKQAPAGVYGVTEAKMKKYVNKRIIIK